MGLMDTLIGILNEREEKNGSDARWEALHTEPVELVETPNGIRHRDIRTGRFKGREEN